MRIGGYSTTDVLVIVQLPNVQFNRQKRRTHSCALNLQSYLLPRHGTPNRDAVQLCTEYR